MRSTSRIAALGAVVILALLAVPAFAADDPALEVISYETISNPVASTAPTVPASCTKALVFVQSQPVHVKLDGGTVDNTYPQLPVGVYMVPMTNVLDKAQVSNLRFINTAAGAATVILVYMRQK